MSFETNWLKWPFERKSREFRIYVVEPSFYKPEKHSTVFDAVLRNFFAPTSQPALSADVLPSIPQPVEAQLIVFPEVFLSSPDLVIAMEGFAQMKFKCCVQVGLRPDYSPRHLFSHSEATELLSKIGGISSIYTEDLNAFSEWLKNGKTQDRYNLGCLFLVDANDRLRVCLHPKAVRAAVEYSASLEEHMTEANLLSLVTLIPPDSRYLSVTVQPLICSDVLMLPRDTIAPTPLKAFSDSSAARFRELPADHIDIVSVGLCTPVAAASKTEEKRRRWRPEFESSFLTTSKGECHRHAFASFVMANFGAIGDKEAGLSGAYVPTPYSATSTPEGVSVWSYGQHGSGQDSWKLEKKPDSADLQEGGQSATRRRSHVLCLDSPSGEDHPIAMALGFTLSRLIRDNPISGKIPGLTQIDIRLIHDTAATAVQQIE